VCPGESPKVSKMRFKKNFTEICRYWYRNVFYFKYESESAVHFDVTWLVCPGESTKYQECDFEKKVNRNTSILVPKCAYFKYDCETIMQILKCIWNTNILVSISTFFVYLFLKWKERKKMYSLYSKCTF